MTIQYNVLKNRMQISMFCGPYSVDCFKVKQDRHLGCLFVSMHISIISSMACSLVSYAYFCRCTSIKSTQIWCREQACNAARKSAEMNCHGIHCGEELMIVNIYYWISYASETVLVALKITTTYNPHIMSKISIWIQNNRRDSEPCKTGVPFNEAQKWRVGKKRRVELSTYSQSWPWLLSL